MNNPPSHTPEPPRPLGKVANALAFFRCCIKCGEAWSDRCDQVFDEAADELNAARQVLPAHPPVSADAIEMIEAIRDESWVDGSLPENRKLARELLAALALQSCTSSVPLPSSEAVEFVKSRIKEYEDIRRPLYAVERDELCNFYHLETALEEAAAFISATKSQQVNT